MHFLHLQDPKALMKQLIDSIPTTKEAVFAAPIDWQSFDEGRASLTPSIQAWVNKKIKVR